MGILGGEPDLLGDELAGGRSALSLEVNLGGILGGADLFGG